MCAQACCWVSEDLGSLIAQRINGDETRKWEVKKSRFRLKSPEWLQENPQSTDELLSLDLEGFCFDQVPLTMIYSHNLQGLIVEGEWEKTQVYDYKTGLWIKVLTGKPTSFPETVGRFHMLAYLNCSNCYLSQLPDAIGRLRKLKYLDCHSNHLTVLPDTIGQLEELTYLDCSLNILEALPDTIGQLQRLAYIYCNVNKLAVLSDRICQLEELAYLNCCDNKLGWIPQDVCQHTHHTLHVVCYSKWTNTNLSGFSVTQKLPRSKVHYENITINNAGCYSSFSPFHLLMPLSKDGCVILREDSSLRTRCQDSRIPKIKLFALNKVAASVSVGPHSLLYYHNVPCDYVATRLQNAIQLQPNDGQAGDCDDEKPINLVSVEVHAAGPGDSQSKECFDQIRKEGVETVQFTCDERVQTVSGAPLPQSAKHLTFCGNHCSDSEDNSHNHCQPRNVPFRFSAFNAALFPSLSHLVLRNLALAEVPLSIGEACSLLHLDLGQNRLEKLPSELIKLWQLEFLSLAQNKILDVSLALTELPHLRCLDVTKNQITELSEPTAICDHLPCNHTGLQELRADGNDLTSFPPWVGRLKVLPWRNESALSKIPAIIVEQGDDAILRYLRMLEKGSGENRCPTLKVGLLGESSAGKTSLAMSLFQGIPYLVDPKDRTKGMTRFVHEIGEQPLAIIDIGGHADYFYLHEAVLLGPAVVVITVNLVDINASTGVLEKADEFYLTILSRARGSLRIVAVGTHADECDASALDVKCQQVVEHFKNLEDRYRQQLKTVANPKTFRQEQLPDYPSVGKELCVQQAKRCLRSIPTAPKFVVVTSAQTLQGYDTFSDVLADCARGLLFHMPKTIPTLWLILDTWLDWLMNGDTPLLMISTHDILAMFPPDEFGPTYQEALKNVRLAMAYMASIGKIVFFADSPVLQDAVFLSPQLLVKLFSVIHRHDLQKSVEEAAKSERLHGAMPDNECQTLIEHAAIFKQSGILSKELISQLWQMAGQPGHQQTVDLLCQLIERLDLGQEMDLVPSIDGELSLQSLPGSSGKGIFLPFYAEISGASMPPKAASFFCRFTDSLIARHDVVLQYSFPMYLPQGLWERCLVRQFRLLRRMWIWQNGGFGDNTGSDGCMGIQRAVSRLKTSWFISLHICGMDEASTWKLALQCCMEIEALLLEWRGLPVSRSVACPHCVDEALNAGASLIDSKTTPNWHPVDNWLLGNVAKQRPRRVLCPGDRDVDVTDVHRIWPTEGMKNELRTHASSFLCLYLLR